LVTNFGVPAVANSSSPLLPDAAVPSLPAAPRSEDAANRAAADNLHSDLATKIGDNDARCSDEDPHPKKIPDIRDITDQ
jgi:hypothetical protein